DFYTEEKFSLCLPDKNSGYLLDKSTDGNTDVYKYGPTVVSSFKPTNVELSGAKLKEFSRFLIYGTHLHPEIRQDIEKSNRVPSKLVCYMENHHASKERTTLTLKKVTFEDYQVSIPPEFTKSVDPRSPLAPVYPRISELGGIPPADFKQQTLAYYKNAVD